MQLRGSLHLIDSGGKGGPLLTWLLAGGCALKGSGALSRNASSTLLLCVSEAPLSASAGGCSSCASSSAERTLDSL